MFPFLLVIAVLIVLIGLSRPKVNVKSHWQHFFDNQNIPSSEFYSRVKDALMERKMELAITEQSMMEKHVLGGWRKYLRIAKDEAVFYVCAAPFGTGTFISFWRCETQEGYLNRVPVLSRLIGKDRKNKTFYQIDTLAMCESGIHTALLSVVEGYNAINGTRIIDRQLKAHKA